MRPIAKQAVLLAALLAITACGHGMDAAGPAPPQVFEQAELDQIVEEQLAEEPLPTISEEALQLAELRGYRRQVAETMRVQVKPLGWVVELIPGERIPTFSDLLRSVKGIELERYGDAGIDLAEALFWADSEAVVAMLPYLTGDSNADERWHMAVLGADALLDDLGFDLDQKFAIMSDMRDGFGREFHADAGFYRQIGGPYRERQKRLFELIDWDFRALPAPAAAGSAVADIADAADADDSGSACGLALKQRSGRIRAVAAELHRRIDAGQLNESPRSLASSYIHMYINRLQRSAQRAQELIIYDYLRRIYASKRARSGRQKREVRT